MCATQDISIMQTALGTDDDSRSCRRKDDEQQSRSQSRKRMQLDDSSTP